MHSLSARVTTRAEPAQEPLRADRVRPHVVGSACREIGEPAKHLEVGDGSLAGDVGDVRTLQDARDGHLELLTGQRTWHGVDRKDHIGHVARGQPRPDGCSYRFPQPVVECRSLSGHDEQRHEVPAVRLLDADDEAQRQRGLPDRHPRLRRSIDTVPPTGLRRRTDPKCPGTAGRKWGSGRRYREQGSVSTLRSGARREGAPDGHLPRPGAPFSSSGRSPAPSASTRPVDTSSARGTGETPFRPARMTIRRVDRGVLRRNWSGSWRPVHVLGRHAHNSSFTSRSRRGAGGDREGRGAGSCPAP